MSTKQIKDRNYKLLFSIVEALGPAETEMLNPIIKRLKTTDGEGWACGEVLERTIRARDLIL